MKVSYKLYKCKVCSKLKQLNEYAIHATGKQKGIRATTTCKLCHNKLQVQKRLDNPGIEAEYKKQYRLDNPEKCREYDRKHKLLNPDKVTHDAAKRRAAKVSRVPKWSTPQDLADIRSIYKACKKISDKTGIKHHVDHVIPLRGKIVSGLHVPSNLQIIPDYLNLQKSNTYEIETYIEDIVFSS